MHSPSKQVSPSWQVAVDRWYPSNISLMGVHQVMDALKKKNVDLLRQAILDHPRVYNAPFHRLDSHCKTLDRGQLAHVVVNLGWTDALDVLWEAGDRFDKKYASDGFTAGEVATHAGKQAMLRRMLKLGLDPDAHRPLAEMLLRRKCQKDGDGKIASMLVQAGANPWVQVNCPNHGELPLVMALLANNAHFAAEEFVRAMTHIPPEINALSVSRCWLMGFERFIRAAAQGDLGAHERMWDILIEKGASPLPLKDLVNAGVSLSPYSYEAHAAHDFMMKKMLAQGHYDRQDLADAQSLALDISTEQSHEWKALLDARLLQATSPSARTPSRMARL